MTIHSSILAREIPWTEEPGGLLSMGHKELDTTEATQHAHIQVRSQVGNEVGSPYNQPDFSMRTLVSASGPQNLLN